MTDATSPNTLPSGKTAMELLELYFLDMRSHLLEVAAGLDRIERAEGGAEALKDPRFGQLIRSLEILGQTGTNRAPAFLEHFSDPA
jgi:hypothetical protein